MKNTIYVLILVAVFGCQTIKTKKNDIKTFFETMTNVETADSLQNKFNLIFKYSFYNPDKESFDYKIPDSILNSDFYNAYANRLISAFYNRINTDTTVSYEELLTVEKNSKVLVEEKVVKYCALDETWNGIFDLATLSFYENDKVEKPSLSVDSLINISMTYFDIAGYSEENGFAFHFVCGTNPFDFEYENITALLVCDFCQEALRNPKMAKTHQEVIAKISDLIKKENSEIQDFQVIKQTYEPRLHSLLKSNEVLKESLITLELQQ